jgi:hypothetical protein
MRTVPSRVVLFSALANAMAAAIGSLLILNQHFLSYRI